MKLITDFQAKPAGKARMDREQLTGLLAPLDLGWRDRTEKELALMADLIPLLKRRAGGRDISGLRAYEDIDTNRKRYGASRPMIESGTAQAVR